MATINHAPLNGAKFISPKVVFALLGYRDSSVGWKAVRRAGIPYVRINARRILFEEVQVRAWIDRHTVGTRMKDGVAS
jgi:hypothetical protein